MTSDPFYKDLNPISFLDRSAHVYPDKPALIYGDITYTYQDFYNRVNKLAGALQKEGIKILTISLGISHTCVMYCENEKIKLSCFVNSSLPLSAGRRRRRNNSPRCPGPCPIAPRDELFP